MFLKVILVVLPHLLSVGYDKALIYTRTLVLRGAGFHVDEAFNLKNALTLVESDSIDVLILCHTLSKEEQRQLISAVRKLRGLLPIICICSWEL